MDTSNFMFLPSVEKIPDFGLYMDQVITFMESYFPERPLTKTMINNYTKDKILFPTKKKKYTREHIMALSLIQVLKKTLTLPEIKQLLEPISQEVHDGKSENLYTFYEDFYKIHQSHLIPLAKDFKQQVDDIVSNENPRIISYAYIANYFISLSEELIYSSENYK